MFLLHELGCNGVVSHWKALPAGWICGRPALCTGVLVGGRMNSDERVTWIIFEGAVAGKQLDISATTGLAWGETEHQVLEASFNSAGEMLTSISWRICLRHGDKAFAGVGSFTT